MRRYKNTGRKGIKAAFAVFLAAGLLLGGCAGNGTQGEQEAVRSQAHTTGADADGALWSPQAGAEDSMFWDPQTGMEDDVFWSPQADSEDGLQRALTAAVEIEAGRWSGSGVVYEETEGGLVIVTAAHVLADAGDQVKVSFYDGWEADCAEYQIFQETDCAFLILPGEVLAEDYRERYAAAQKDRERFDSVEGGESIFLADPGNENGFGYRFALLSENWIYVEDFGQYMMLLSGEADAGMSGSGAYDEFGCFLGILCGMSEEDDELAVLPYNIVDAMYRQLELRND